MSTLKHRGSAAAFGDCERDPAEGCCCFHGFASRKSHLNQRRGSARTAGGAGGAGGWERIRMREEEEGGEATRRTGGYGRKEEEEGQDTGDAEEGGAR